MKKLFLHVLLLCSLHQSFSAVIYVNANASGTNNGTSWLNAYTNLQAAISSSIYGDQIWVATGVYKASSTNNRDTFFVMKNGVDLYGGFSGTETSTSQRDLDLNPTTLSGDIGELGSNIDNTKTLVKMSNISTNLIFDGFRIVSGYDSVGSGAGFNILNNSGTINIHNCVIYNNYAYSTGGGAYIKASTVNFNNCDFLYNSSFDYGGGAVYAANVSNSTINIQESKFIGNTSRSGAVVKFQGISLIMNRVLVSSNSATSGGGIIDISAGIFTLSNSLVAGNVVSSNGQSVLSSYSTGVNSTNLINVTFCHNRNSSTLTPYREVIYGVNAPINIYNSIIFGNSNADTNKQINSGNNVVNSIVENGYPTGSNNLSSSPSFVSPALLATAPFDATDYDYSLNANSPAINSGNNIFASGYPVDYLGNERIQQSVIDRGAIESSHSLSINENVISSDFLINSQGILFNLSDSLYDSTYTVYDLQGKIIKKGVLTSSPQDLELNIGFYIIKVGQSKPKKISIVN